MKAVKLIKNKKKVKFRYDETANFYNKRYLAIQEEKVKLLTKKFGFSNENIVDLGCGTCILKKFMPNSAFYLGVDVSRNMLKESLSNQRNLNLIQADVEHLPLKSGYFKRVFFITILQNLSEFHRVFKEMKRISTEGSTFHVSILKKDKSLSQFENLMQLSDFSLKEKVEREELEDIIFIYEKKKRI